LKLTSIAFSILSTGINGFPKDNAVDIVVEQALRYLQGHPYSSVKTVKLISTDDRCNKQFQGKLTELFLEPHGLARNPIRLPSEINLSPPRGIGNPFSNERNPSLEKGFFKFNSVPKSKSCKSCNTTISVPINLNTTMDYFKCPNCKKVHCAAHGDNLMEKCFCFCPKCIGSTTEVSEPSKAKICRKCNVSLCWNCGCSKSCEVDIVCTICLDKKKDTVFLPCKHLSCCYGCAERLRNQPCPICRGKVQDMMKIYL